MSAEFERNLDTYAELIVKVGLNLQSGQRLLVQAPIAAALLVRRVAAHAYSHGARLVDVIWSDQHLELIRLQSAARQTLAEHSTWAVEGAVDFASRGDAFLWVYANDPDLLRDQDPGAVATLQQTAVKVMAPFSQHIARNALNWLVVAAPVPGWADKIFPDASPEARDGRLWDTLFDICRAKQPDAVDAWRRHVDRLVATGDYLTRKQYKALRLVGPGTDLKVGLPAGHVWRGGRVTSEGGIPFTPNIPTEEVFTMPHKAETEGIVAATRPLSYGGTMIESFQLTFAEGRVVDIRAERGAELLRSLIETDEGAARLGEVALVPHSSAISRSGLLFYNILLDENASNHLALGRAYRFTLENGIAMSDDDFAAAGGNDSLIHIDFMVGSDKLNVDGVTENGSVEPVMRNGEWAFEV